MIVTKLAEECESLAGDTDYDARLSPPRSSEFMMNMMELHFDIEAGRISKSTVLHKLKARPASDPNGKTIYFSSPAKDCQQMGLLSFEGSDFSPSPFVLWSPPRHLPKNHKAKRLKVLRSRCS